MSTHPEGSSETMLDEHDSAPSTPEQPEKPPRGVGIMSVVRWAVLALTILAATGSWWTFAHADAASSAAPKYQCPMHPQIVSDKPGECPICFMSLEPISADRRAKAPGASPSAMPAAPPPAPRAPAPEASAGAPSAATQYTCPMHPEVLSDKPGRCPICKMELEPVHKPDAGSEAPGAIPAGTMPVTLALDRLQAIGVRTSPVEERTVDSPLRVTAVVSAPEQNVAEVHVRASGFVEGISVRETGVSVKAGQLLVSVYSPEIYQAQSELLAMRDMPSLDDAGLPSHTEAARRKLELLGVSSRVSDRILASGKPLRAIGLSAPISGVVTRKNVVLGSFVTPEMVLYEITDLSRVYVLADVFQDDMGRVAVGTTGSFRSSSRKDVTTEAKVDLVYPRVDSQARTTRVRMQLDNKGLALLPGEYGYVEFTAPPKTAFTVPRDAVVDTGRQVYVFVEEGPGRFAPRVVETGAESDGMIEVRSGLAKGLRVVSGATFLLDSESRLQASLAALPATSP